MFVLVLAVFKGKRIAIRALSDTPSSCLLNDFVRRYCIVNDFRLDGEALVL